MKGYKTSKDYKQLKELLDAGQTIIVLWQEKVMKRKFQRAFAAFKDGDYYYLGVLCWAESYIKGAGWDFVPYCDAHNLEFIVPTNE